MRRRVSSSCLLLQGLLMLLAAPLFYPPNLLLASALSTTTTSASSPSPQQPGGLLRGSSSSAPYPSSRRGGRSSSSSFEAGYITVNETTKSEMFYWFFPAQSGNTSAPLILWLQGGPGASGLVGLFYEMGPYTLVRQQQQQPSQQQEEEEDGSGGWVLVEREVGSWCDDYSMLFVDNPVGTGFSRTGSEVGYASSEEDVVRDLWQLMQGFYLRYPETAKNDLHVFGESYGGHYGPQFAAHIVEKNQRIALSPSSQQKEVPLPLASLGVGDGLTDPAVQELAKPAAAYAFGLLDAKQRLALHASSLARRGDYIDAKKARVQLEDLITSSSGVDLHDVRVFLADAPDLDKPIAQWANTHSTRQALHLPEDAVWNTSAKVMQHLEGDVMRSSASKVAYLLDHAHIPVLLYQGQFDAKDGVLANQAWIAHMKWSGRAGWLAANRTVWYLDDGSEGGEPAGWVRQYGLLTQVVVQGAGHLLPMTQPERALDMVKRFIQQRPFTSSTTTTTSPSQSHHHHDDGDGNQVMMMMMDEEEEEEV